MSTSPFLPVPGRQLRFQAAQLSVFRQGLSRLDVRQLSGKISEMVRVKMIIAVKHNSKLLLLLTRQCHVENAHDSKHRTEQTIVAIGKV